MLAQFYYAAFKTSLVENITRLCLMAVLCFTKCNLKKAGRFYVLLTTKISKGGRTQEFNVQRGTSTENKLQLKTEIKVLK